MKVISSDGGPWYIMVLGERNLYCLEDLGIVLFSKKLESYATCILPYKYGKERENDTYSTIGPKKLWHKSFSNF